MTRPRTSTTRELYGILGKVQNASAVQKEWNAHFAEHNIDAFMDRYPTTEKNLHERLSEMFHFDRRLYLVADDLQEAIIPLLDIVDAEIINIVWNEGGLLVGKWIEGAQVENLHPQS